MTGVWLALSVYLCHLSQRAVRGDLRPKRERLMRLLEQVEEP